MSKELVSWCLDERMRFELLAELCKQHNIEKYHPAPAGGCALLLSQQYEHIETIVKLKNPERANLFGHLTCLAYETTFGKLTREQEIEKQGEVMREEAQKLQEKFPTIKYVRLFLLTDVTPERIGTNTMEIPYTTTLVA